jgi:hypothetical protein
MRRYEHEGVIYLQFSLHEIWKNWRMSDALDQFRSPPRFVPLLQDYLNRRPKIKFYIDGINSLPTFRFEDEADEKAFMKLFSPKGGG